MKSVFSTRASGQACTFVWRSLLYLVSSSPTLTPTIPSILGGLGPSEGNVGYLQASLKGFILLSRSVYFTCVVDNLVNKVKGTCFNSKLKFHYKAGVGKNIQVLSLSPQHRCV